MAHFLSTVACVPLLSMSITALATTAPVFNSGSHAVLARRIGSGKGKGKAKNQTKKGDGEDFLSFAEGENKEKEAKKKRAQKAKKKTPSLSMQSNAAVASEVAAFHRAMWEREDKGYRPKWEREAAEKFVGPLPGRADADDEQMRGFYTAFLKDDLRGPTDRSHLRLGLT
jgi:hypothetical protein